MYNGVDIMKIVIEKRIRGRALMENGVSRARDGCFLYGSSAFARNGVTRRVCVCLLSRANRFFPPDG